MLVGFKLCVLFPPFFLGGGESFNCFYHHVNKRPDSPSPEMLTCVIKAECCDLSPAAADVKNPCDPSTSLRSPSPQETLRSTRNWPKNDQLDNSRYVFSPKKNRKPFAIFGFI